MSEVEENGRLRCSDDLPDAVLVWGIFRGESGSLHSTVGGVYNTSTGIYRASNKMSLMFSTETNRLLISERRDWDLSVLTTNEASPMNTTTGKSKYNLAYQGKFSKALVLGGGKWY